MQIKAYANYNESGRKYPIIRMMKGDIYNEATIQIPDNWEVYETISGEIGIVLPDGTRCMMNDLYTKSNGKTVFYSTVTPGKEFAVQTIIHPRTNLKEMLADFNGNYKSPDVSWGSPVGKEVW